MSALSRCTDHHASTAMPIEADRSATIDPRAADEFRRWFNRRWPRPHLAELRADQAAAGRP